LPVITHGGSAFSQRRPSQMTAVRKADQPEASGRPALRILRPENEHRTNSPSDVIKSPVSGGSLEKWQAEHSEESRAKLVSDDDRPRYAAQTTLREFYQHCQSGRFEMVGRQSRTKSTAEKDVQALSAWERATRPEDWPADQAWLGPSLAFIEDSSSAWFYSVFERMHVGVGLSAASVNGGIRGALLTILNHAVKVRAMTRRPECERLKQPAKLADIYSEEDVENTVHQLLKAGHEEIATAFLFDLSVGVRSADLFSLTREQITLDTRSRPVLELSAEKTGKSQRIPLAPSVRALIDRRCPASGPLFPSFFSPNALRPNQTKPARRRNDFLKAAQTACGIERLKPWQSCRSTLNERLESTPGGEGVGEFVLGHSAKRVNARSYRNPTEVVYRTINALPVYPSLMKLAGLYVDSGETYCGCG